MKQLALGLAAAVLVLDQLTKWIMVRVITENGYFIEVTGFFNLVLVHNTGVSFGFLGTLPAWVLIVVSLAIVVGLSIWLVRQDRRLPTIGIGLVIGGALGNVIDRLHAPGVIDFLDFHVAGYHWPAFNVADAAITIGIGIILFDSLFLDREQCT
ncbi:MAG: signal peptidase II [Pseudomonadota bacterium]